MILPHDRCTCRFSYSGSTLSPGIYQRDARPANQNLTGSCSAANVYSSEKASSGSHSALTTPIFRAQNLDFGQALYASIPDVVDSLRSEDFKEGGAHFVEKRAPRFKGGR